MTNIGITGSTGFLGSALVRHFAQMPDYKVYGFFRSLGGPGVLGDAVDQFHSVQWVRGDLNAREDCERFVEPLDVVLHLAHTHTAFHESISLASNHGTNVLPSLRLLEAIRASGRCPQFVYFSSGGQIYGHSISRTPFNETTPCLPITSYGIQKLAIEHYVRIMAESGHLRGVVLRVANPYGRLLPAMRMQGLVGVALDLVRRGQPVPIVGNSNVVRDYMHIKDMVGAVQKALSYDGSNFEILNVGTGRGTSVNEILNLIARYSGRKVETTDRALPDGVVSPDWNVLDCSKANLLLGWKASLPIESGIEVMCRETFGPVKSPTP